METNKQNFISADFKSARNSYDEYFEIGDNVKHEGAGEESATIYRFSIDSVQNEVLAHTSKGWAHIDFIYKN